MKNDMPTCEKELRMEESILKMLRKDGGLIEIEFVMEDAADM